MEDPRECVDLIDDWYVRRGDGRILLSVFGEPLLSGLMGSLGGLLSPLGDFFLRRELLLSDGPSGIVGRSCLNSPWGS